MSEDTDEPVHVVDYDRRWADDGVALTEHLREVLPNGVAVEHIGSTAVPGLAAKPILDVLVGVHELTDIDEVVATLVAHGWAHFGEAGVRGRQYLRRRIAGRDANVHVTQYDSELWRDNIVLRDYLLRSEGARERYADGKRKAAGRRPTLLAYSDEKAALVRQLLAEARDRT